MTPAETSPYRQLADRLLAGERLALSRMMTAVEAGDPVARAELPRLYPHTGRAQVIGVTGPPGAGKSTLVSRLATEYRSRGKTVGIVAVDPTSPYSGGAILGDRIRMMTHHGDPEVFVRSMATRGTLGGLARATMEIVGLLDAFGKDVVLVETVGVGQDEVDIASAADTTLVVCVPGLGDDVQAIKAGILEIADILVVNKADLKGADQLAAQLRSMLSLGDQPHSDWLPPIQSTTATDAINASGVSELADRIAEHQAYLQTAGLASTRRQLSARRHIQSIVEETLEQRLVALTATPHWRSRIADAAARATDPYSLAAELLGEISTPS